MERWATFDCYGTLVDWNGGIRAELARIFGEDAADAKLAEYHELEPVIERGGACAPIGRSWHVPVRLVAPRRNARPRRVPIFLAGVPGGTRESTRRGRGARQLCILSNTDRDFIDASMTAISVPFDSRSPPPRSARTSRPRQVEALEKDVGRLPDVHVAASLFHDVAPTAELGIPCIWVNRLREGRGRVHARRAKFADARIPPEVLDELAP